jgi:hypothetical protein
MFPYDQGSCSVHVPEILAKEKLRFQNNVSKKIRLELTFPKYGKRRRNIDTSKYTNDQNPS